MIHNHNDKHNDNTITHDNHKNKLAAQRGHVRKALHTIQQKMEDRRNGIIPQLDRAMVKIMIASMDVAEFYGPPRIADMVRTMALRAGRGMDLATQDDDGRAWDFNIFEMRNGAARRILTDRPLLRIGGPKCTFYSTMNHGNRATMATAVV